MPEHDEQGHEAQEQRPRRPRVVDKRIAARGTAREGGQDGGASSASDQQAAAPPGPQRAPQEAGAGPRQPAGETGPRQQQPAQQVWTPEQEAQARAIAEEMARVPVTDWVVNVAVNLANVAGVKLQSGQAAEAQVAIDALAGLLEGSRGRLAGAEGPLRQTLAELQMAYARTVAGPGPAPGGGAR